MYKDAEEHRGLKMNSAGSPSPANNDRRLNQALEETEQSRMALAHSRTEQLREIDESNADAEIILKKLRRVSCRLTDWLTD